MKSHYLTASLLVALSIPTGPGPLAATADDPDWPCEQALVPEVTAAVVWDGPGVESLGDRWSGDQEVAALVHRLVARDVDDAAAEAAIESFAMAQPAAERDHRLSLLFAGVLQLLNADRRKLNQGILRYARDQQRRAELLGEHLAEIARIESDTSAAARERLAALHRQVELEQRVFDERELTIPYLCTRPRVVEERIGRLARTIAYHLE